jgi:hypothetical protein
MLIDLNKKAQSNMFWIIIAAVIALVVMIVLMIMFTGKTSKLEGGLSGCESKSGVCISSESNCPKNTLKTTAFECTDNNVCCVGAAKSCNNVDDCGSGESCVTYGTGSYCN